MGILTVQGSLRVAQFWPKGGADADTATVEVVLARRNAFVYTDDRGRKQETRAFMKAEVVGRQGPQPVVRHDKRLDSDKINVRLQGIDAPELHYQPTVKGSAGKNGKFRQCFGESCAHALLRYLSQLKMPEIPCEVFSRVLKPSDVCDVYGRVVGNLVITLDGARVDLNHWIISEGWALPSFYNSMTKSEIRQLMADFTAAKDGKRGIHSGRYVVAKLVKFNDKRRYRKGPATFKPLSDKGSVNSPKFFRRQAEHHVKLAVGTAGIPASFSSFVSSKKEDKAVGREIFLAHRGSGTAQSFGKQLRQLGTFVKQGSYPIGTELVYWEAAAKLVKAGTKKEITSW